MRLNQISQIFGARGVKALQTILTESPFIAFLDSKSAFEQDAMSYSYRPANNTYSAVARNLGGTYSATDLTPTALQNASQYILGGALDVDIRTLRDAELGYNKIDVNLEKQLMRAYRGYALSVQAKLFNGTGEGTPTEIKGLKTILNGTDDIPGFTGQTGVINAATFGASGVKSLDLTSTNTSAEAQFKALLLSMLNEVTDPQGIVMNNKLFTAISAFQDLSRNIGETSTNYGTKLRTIYGVPIINVDATTITVTEADDTATPLNTTTSMYIMTPAEMKTSLVTNSGLYYIEYDHMENKESGREKWEMSLSWKIEDTTSIKRVRNLKV